MAKFLIAGIGITAERKNPAALVIVVSVTLGPTTRSVVLRSVLMPTSRPRRCSTSKKSLPITNISSTPIPRTRNGNIYKPMNMYRHNNYSTSYITVLTWVVVMLNDTPAVAVNPKAAAEASATNIKPTYACNGETHSTNVNKVHTALGHKQKYIVPSPRL